MKKLLFTLTFALIGLFVSAKTVNVSTPGTLSSFFTSTEADTVTILKITGNINARDIYYMRDELQVLAVLDIKEVTINSYKTYPSNTIPSFSFKTPNSGGKVSLKSIKLPSSITAIDTFAFQSCSGLTGQLLIPNGVTYIGPLAFWGDSLLTGTLNIPYSVTKIDDLSFFNCKGLSGKLTIPNSVTSIGHAAFYHCEGISSLMLPNSLPFLKSSTFEGCIGLKSITVARPVPPGLDIPFYGINKTTCHLTVPLGSKAIYQSTDVWNEFLNISEAILVTYNSYGGGVYDDLMLTDPAKILEPENPIKTSYSFDGWYKEPAFKTVWNFASDSVKTNTTLYAKWVLNKTINITTPGTLNTLLTKTEADTTIYLVLTGNINAKDICFMRDCMPLLALLDLSSTRIMAYEGTQGTINNFWNLNKKYSYPANTMPVISFCYPMNAGKGKESLRSIKLPSGILKIDGWAFSGCGLNQLSIPNSVISIDSFAFINNRNLSGTLIIPSSVNIICAYAFVDCDKINKLIIPNSCKLIEYQAFDFFGFANINIIVNRQEPPIIKENEDAFGNLQKTSGKLIVPRGAKLAYQAAYSWKDFMHMEEASLVIFNTNGGNSINEFLISDTTTISAPTDPIKTGYTFVGWYKDSFQTNIWDFINDSVKDNITLYAKWSINSYTVSFNSNEGSSISEISSNYNTLINEPISPTKTGYSFDGWYDESGFINKWNFGKDSVKTNTTLYAKWSINNYSVSFNTKGGNSIANVNANYNTKITVPTALTKNGFVFAGWYADSTYLNTWNFATALVTKDTTLFAKWMASVTFSVQGGSNIDAILADINTTIAAPSNPFKTGYTFVGWYKDITYTSVWDFASDIVVFDTTLFAKWTINNYTVSFDSKGGTSITDINADYNTKISAPEAPSLTGYTFTGWYKDATYSSVWNFESDVIILDRTLYAKWAINSYTLSFDSKGGSSVSSIKINYNTSIAAPSKPTLLGYSFIAWYKDSTYVNAWNFSTDKITSDTTLYAKWSINSYTVSFDSKGGTTIADINADYNTKISAPSSPTLLGYTFEGWFKEASLINEWNFTSDIVTADTNLYAKWTINTGITNTTNTETISIYPNPVDVFVTIKGSNLQKASIYNLAGVEVLQIELKGEETSILLNNLKAGCYFISVKTSNGSQTKKLLKK